MVSPVRIAVAGAGLIGQQHISRILGHPDATLATIIDPSPKAREQAEMLGVPYFETLEAGIDGTKPDGVILGTPNKLHVSGGLTAVQAGVATLVEKPVSDEVETAMMLAEASEKADVPVLVGHHRRHSPLIQSAKAIIEQGKLGRMSAVNGLCWFRKPDEGYFDGAYSWRREPGGGVVLINLIHVIDDLRNLCGEIVSVQAAASNAIREFPVEDTAAIILRFANGALGTLNICDSASAPWSWEMTSGENKMYPKSDEACYWIAGTEGSLSVPKLDFWHYDGSPHWGRPIQVDRTIAPEEDPLVRQLTHFCKVARREVAPLVDARSGTKTLAATLAVRQAAFSGGIVDLAI